MTDFALAATVDPLQIIFPESLPLPVELTAISRGMQGAQGVQGVKGDVGEVDDMPDLSLIFDNALI